MTTKTVNASTDNGRATGSARDDVPQLPVSREIDQTLPRLHMPGAYTMVRDRWERLVTAIEIPSAPEAVWQALTDPESLRRWLAVSRGPLAQEGRESVLDFEDGEFFICHTLEAQPLRRLRYLWRWLGIGQATYVTWDLLSSENGTRVVVTEEARNAPWDWQTWNGGGWPGILDQLAAYLRTGMSWRWPWRRMGPYAQIELPVSVYEAWDRLFNPASLKYWLLTMRGSLTPGETLPIFMGDASGMIEMTVQDVVQPGEAPPSFLPAITFAFKRSAWSAALQGRIWIDPSGWNGSILQALLYNWEGLSGDQQLSERKILTSYWAGAAQRACMLCSRPNMPEAGHNWS